jgi:hypothetical protein
VTFESVYYKHWNKENFLPSLMNVKDLKVRNSFISLTGLEMNFDKIKSLTVYSSMIKGELIFQNVTKLAIINSVYFAYKSFPNLTHFILEHADIDHAWDISREIE